MVCIGTGCHSKPETIAISGPVSTEDAISTFNIEPGFKIELLASEPLVSDPVDMEIDEFGRLYVLEMHGYPLDKSGAGKIRILSDVNGDGRMDSSIVFADSLVLPFGIMRWKNGLLVADAPNILYFEDNNGDNVSDIRDTVLTGFAFSNAQMNAGNPLYGLDNWIYLTSESGGTYQIYKKEFGDLGSDIVYPGKRDSPKISLEGTGRTVRFKPDHHQLELTSGMTQFGHDFDVWGRRLLGNNSNHIYHEVIAAQYLKRNADLLVSGSTETLTDHGSEVYPIARNPDHQILSAKGVFTSACGTTAYTGGAFPGEFNNKVSFIAEPVSNVVHADLIKDKGATFVASRMGRKDKEFLASTDSWFRPVNMYVGPDGALYVLDYYRQIIEHPEWMSEEAINAGGLYNGIDRGRIYRITSTKANAATWTKGLQLGKASSNDLVKELANANRWWRMNAQRLLVDRADKRSVPALKEMIRSSSSSLGRLHALWTLQGIDALDAETLSIALKDSEPAVRENAIKLAELHLSKSPELENALLTLQDDADPKVRFQLLCTIGYLNTAAAAQARNKILFTNVEDEWVQVAALTAPSQQSSTLLEEALARYDAQQPAYASLVHRLASMTAPNNNIEAIRRLIQRAVANTDQPTWQPAVLEGLSEGLRRRDMTSLMLKNEERLLVQRFFEDTSASIRKASLQLLKTIKIHDAALLSSSIQKAVTMSVNRSLPDARRTEAISFLALGDLSKQKNLLKSLIVPQEHSSIQVAALNALSRVPGNAVTEYILDRWKVLTPEIREAAINTFLSSLERVVILLDAIDSGRIQKSSLNFIQGVQLMTYGDDKLRKRARSIFANNDEQKVTKEYQPALRLKGDQVKGKAIFTQNCRTCHQFRGKLGSSFGPDLGTVSKWQPEGIMANILAPNLSIAPNYELWAVELNNGESAQGIITNETTAAIKIKNAGGLEKLIKRSDIKSLKTLDVSAMPAGLEQNISQQEMADLLAFLREYE